MIGELIGERYRVIRKISSGGMGVVCEGVHEVTGRRVALKVIRDVASFGGETDAWLERFKREARVAGSIDTPHITQVFDASTDAATGRPFIAMELLTGRDLSAVLKEVGPLPAEIALKIVAQACIGLERAHEAGVIHRDIKPGNVFLSEQKSGEITVKLVDFGIAKVVDDPTEVEGADLTQTGSLLGTPAYMSPEQAKGSKLIDVRSDVWALGVVLYKVLSDTTPHDKRDGVGQLIILICTVPAPNIQSRAPWVTPEVARILDKALRIDPAQRYQTAAEMRADVEQLIVGDRRLELSMIRGLAPEEQKEVARRYDSAFPAASSAETQPGVVRAHAAKPSKRSAWPWLVAVALAGVGGSGVWWMTRKSQPPAPVGAVETKSEPAPAVGADRRSVEVDIDPKDAEVSVDGKPRKLADGKLTLAGKLGSTFTIRVEADGREQSSTVVIAEDGAVPSSLILPRKPTEPRAAARSPVQPRTGKPKPEKPPAEKKETGVGVVNEFE